MEILKIVTKVIYNLLFVLLLVSASFILFTTYNVIPGYNFYVVMSGSMEPEIKVGSVVGIKEQEEYEVDDVITVQMPYSDWETYTHRIIEVRKEDEITYRTKGDANEDRDPDPVSEEQVLGSVFTSIPLIGYLVSFAKKPTGFILLVAVPSVIIVASEINVLKEETKKLIKSKKEKKKDKEKKDKKPKKKKSTVVKIGDAIVNIYNKLINIFKKPFKDKIKSKKK